MDRRCPNNQPQAHAGEYCPRCGPCATRPAHTPGGPGGPWWDSNLTPPPSASSHKSTQSSTTTTGLRGPYKEPPTSLHLPTDPARPTRSNLRSDKKDERFEWSESPPYGIRPHPLTEVSQYSPLYLGPLDAGAGPAFPQPNLYALRQPYAVPDRECEHCRQKGQCSRPSRLPLLNGGIHRNLYDAIVVRGEPSGCSNCHGLSEVYRSRYFGTRKPSLCASCAEICNPQSSLLTPGHLTERTLMSAGLNHDASEGQLSFPKLDALTRSGSRIRAYSCDAIVSSTKVKVPETSALKPDTSQRGEGGKEVKSVSTSPTIPADIQSDSVSSSSQQSTGEQSRTNAPTPTSSNDSNSPKTPTVVSSTVSRATSPFVVKMATQTLPVEDDPTLKALVKTTVMFNDVEYNIPSKFMKRSRSQEYISPATAETEGKDHVYWEVTEPPLRGPFTKNTFRFLRPRESRKLSEDSVTSGGPLIKRKSGGGFFKLGRSSKKYGSCLSSKALLRNITSRRTTDTGTMTRTTGPAPNSRIGVSRVKLYNANSERYEAAVGRNHVHIPAVDEAEDTTMKVSGKQKQPKKQSALGRIFKRKPESGMKWTFNPEYYTVRQDNGQYVLPDEEDIQGLK